LFAFRHEILQATISALGGRILRRFLSFESLYSAPRALRFLGYGG
jgi:hypothetical protein